MLTKGATPAARSRCKNRQYLISFSSGFLTAVLALCYFAISDITTDSRRLTDTFNRMYAEARWGKDLAGKGTSGTGSTLEITQEYRAYLQDFIKKHNIKSVVDAGCGDWNFSKEMDWSDVSYLGVDIASDVIEAVRNKHEKDTIKFQVGDITNDLPAADLLISKDVLQHLPNKLIHKFIMNNLRKENISG